MRFQHLARHPDIGCNSCLIEFDDVSVVIDAGIHPKHVGRDTLPLVELLSDTELDAVIVSHAHLDHIGALPYLMNKHRDTAVLMTKLTAEFGSALLHNSVNVMKAQRTELNELDYPLFSHQQVDRCAREWITREVGETFRLGDRLRVQGEFFAAGHVPGAVGIKLTENDRSIFYTGDVHFEDQTLVRGGNFPREHVSTLVIETTRGASAREPGYHREKEKQRFGEAICRTIERGGSVLIPVFAFGKTQEVLLMLHELRQSGDIPVVPVHIGGLSTRITQITDLHADADYRRHPHFQMLRDFEDLWVLPRGQRQPKARAGEIYALSSGMMTEHTVSHRFGRRHISQAENSLLMVGYADAESAAGRILAAGQGGQVLYDHDDDAPVDIRCEVERFDFSGHACRDQLLDFAVSCSPDNILLVHGDPDAKAWFEQHLRQRLPHTRVMIPQPGQVIEL